MFLKPLDDHSRVILSPTESEPDSHYINANFVDVSIMNFCFLFQPILHFFKNKYYIFLQEMLATRELSSFEFSETLTPSAKLATPRLF